MASFRPIEVRGFSARRLAFETLEERSMLSITFNLASRSAGSTGESATASGVSISPSSAVSADGRFVVFTSDADDLVAGMNILPGVRNVYRYDRATDEVMLVSVNLAGDGGGNRDSGQLEFLPSSVDIHPAMSADGNIVVYMSWASNLDSRDNNDLVDVYARDIAAGTTFLVSVNQSGTEGSGGYSPKISADGKCVVFFSGSNDLQPIPVHSEQLFVRDLSTGVTQLVSVSSDGSQEANQSIDDDDGVSISGDGNLIAFVSYASNLQPMQFPEHAGNVFVRNLTTGATQLISVNTSGTGGVSSYSGSPLLSTDGSSVAFISTATNLHPLKSVVGGRSYWDAFVCDLNTGEMHLASINSSGTGGANNEVGQLSISADGRVVVFQTKANNLDSADTDNLSDVFAYSKSTGETVLVSNDLSSVSAIDYGTRQPTLSADGTTVAFVTVGAILARSLVTGETTLIAQGTPEIEDDSHFTPSLSADGSVIAFWSEAADLVERDWNQSWDVFVAQLPEPSPAIPGDFNRDGQVDSADFSVWRDTLGQTVVTLFDGADGDGDGTIDNDDYLVWKAHFGTSLTPANGAAAATAQPTDSARPVTEPVVLSPRKRLFDGAFANWQSSTDSTLRRLDRVHKPSAIRPPSPQAHDSALVAWSVQRLSHHRRSHAEILPTELKTHRTVATASDVFLAFSRWGNANLM